jgi:hypothetical protein
MFGRFEKLGIAAFAAIAGVILVVSSVGAHQAHVNAKAGLAPFTGIAASTAKSGAEAAQNAAELKADAQQDAAEAAAEALQDAAEQAAEAQDKIGDVDTETGDQETETGNSQTQQPAGTHNDGENKGGD